MNEFRKVGTLRIGAASADLPADQRTELAQECDASIGRVLTVQPIYGYGWYHEAKAGGPKAYEVPEPFHVRVQRIYTYLGERRGIVGRITEPDFIYDEFWLVSMTRHVGIWNFTDRPAQSNLLICPDTPLEGAVEDAPAFGEQWPVWQLRGHPQASGFGIITGLEASEIL